MGIVHRDVKPENVFVDPEDRPLLADFGLARSMTGDSQLTMAGVAIGTPAYMPPEQIEGASLDARGDIYSLGLVAWEMLTGHRPWEGESLYAILYRQRYEQLPDVRDLRGDALADRGGYDRSAGRRDNSTSHDAPAAAERGYGAIHPTRRRCASLRQAGRRTTRRAPAHAATGDRADATVCADSAGERRAAPPECSIRRARPGVDAAVARRARAVVHRLGRVFLAGRGARCSRRRAGLRDEPQVGLGAGRRRGRGNARGSSGKLAGAVE
jgi:serine/threonine protein kinase